MLFLCDAAAVILDLVLESERECKTPPLFPALNFHEIQFSCLVCLFFLLKSGHLLYSGGGKNKQKGVGLTSHKNMQSNIKIGKIHNHL